MKYDTRNLSFLLSRILVLFWALWWTIAFITDVSGTLQHGHLISGVMFDINYPAVKKAIGQYSHYQFLPVAAFGIIIIWEFLSAVTLLWATSLSFNPEKWMKATMVGFIVSLGLWLFFFLGDQIFLTFDIEASGMTQAGVQFLSLILIILLENNKSRWWS